VSEIHESPLFWSQHFPPIRGGLIKLDEIEIDDGRVVLTPIRLQGETIFSPGLGSFGGPFCREKPLDSKESLQDYISKIFEKFNTAKKLKMVLPPEYFFEDHFYKQSVLLENLANTNSVVIDQNQHIDLKENTGLNFSHSARKKLRQLQELEYEVVESRETYFIAEAWEILQKNRLARGVTLSLTREELISSFSSAGNIYKALILKIRGVPAAAAVTVRIASEIEYVLYWGELPEFRQNSPVIGIAHFLLTKSDSGIKYLDLGVSSISGVLDFGLHKFKSNLGAHTSNRKILTLTKG